MLVIRAKLSVVYIHSNLEIYWRTLREIMAHSRMIFRRATYLRLMHAMPMRNTPTSSALHLWCHIDFISCAISILLKSRLKIVRDSVRLNSRSAQSLY